MIHKKPSRPCVQLATGAKGQVGTSDMSMQRLPRYFRFMTGLSVWSVSSVLRGSPDGARALRHAPFSEGRTGNSGCPEGGTGTSAKIK